MATAEELLGRVSTLLRGADAAQLIEYVDIVTEFVRGYTRGNGFDLEGNPGAGLSAVIVVATARLAVNPEQATAYTANDYSERPAVFQGYTLAEQAVLHRYRKRAV